MSKPNIILTGFMGTGKSTLGRLLAKRIGYEFIDTDDQIEQRIGRTIAELFQDEGEAAFRKLESEIAQELAHRKGLVIATGGGLVLNAENVEALNQTGQIICLTAPVEEILARTAHQQQIRPLLQEPDPQKTIHTLLQQRAPVYRQFPQLSTSGRTTDELVEKLLELIQLS